jgi:hypothetical protein
LFALAVLSVVLAQCSASGGSGGSADALVRFTPKPSTAPTLTPSPTPTPSGAGGGITIVVPSPSPVLCTPEPTLVAVGQHVVIDCTAQGYTGSFTWMVANPAIASVEQFNNETFTVFVVTGLEAGTTTLTLASAPQGMGSDTIVVSP